MRRIVVLIVLSAVALLLQGCDVYHRQSTGDNVSVPVTVPDPAAQS